MHFSCLGDLFFSTAARVTVRSRWKCLVFTELVHAVPQLLVDQGGVHLFVVCERERQFVGGKEVSYSTALGKLVDGFFFFRFGVIFSTRGGILPRLLPLYKLRFGARLGNGQQWMSWVSLYDAAQAILFLLEKEHADIEVREPVFCRFR